MNRLRVWAVVSSTIALLGFAFGPGWWLYDVTFYSSNDIPDPIVISAAIWLGWLWIGVFCVTPWFVGWQALWLLLGAPFALGWPFLWVFIARACSLAGNCQ
jgi:hypothetical protein